MSTTVGTFARVALVALATATIAAMISILATGGSASAQPSPPYRVCSDYARVLSSGDAGAATALRQAGAPNPPGIEQALDVLISAATAGTETPSDDEFAAAEEALIGYFGPICDDLDLCPLIRALGNADRATAAHAALLLRGLLAPSPPGLDQAFFVIGGGDVAESPFHDTYEQAQDQAVAYFGKNCESGSSSELAFTGPGEPTGALATIGLGLLAVGAAVVVTVRRSQR